MNVSHTPSHKIFAVALGCNKSVLLYWKRLLCESRWALLFHPWWGLSALWEILFIFCSANHGSIAEESWTFIFVERITVNLLVALINEEIYWWHLNQRLFWRLPNLDIWIRHFPSGIIAWKGKIFSVFSFFAGDVLSIILLSYLLPSPNFTKNTSKEKQSAAASRLEACSYFMQCHPVSIIIP